MPKKNIFNDDFFDLTGEVLTFFLSIFMTTSANKNNMQEKPHIIIDRTIQQNTHTKQKNTEDITRILKKKK